GVEAGITIKPWRRPGAGPSRPHDRAHAARRLADQPEAVAADMVHVRIDGGDGGRHGDHRLDGVAAFGEDGAAVLDRGAMWRADNASAVTGGVEGHAICSVMSALVAGIHVLA